MNKRAKRKESKLDIAMAALAASSVAFVIYAMPNIYFEEAVASTGLPLIVDAAQPPLGATARLGAVLAAAAATFALVWLVLRSLGPKKAPAPRREPEITRFEIAPPRIRRADAHPDAPSRRPILAGLDLGGSFDQLGTFDSEEEAAKTPADEVSGLEAQEDEPEEPREEENPRPFPSFLVLEQPEEERHEPAFEELAAALPEVPDVEQTSIPHLMQRLELGLVRREHGEPRHQAGEPGEADRIDERLRGAIADLQKLTARGS